MKLKEIVAATGYEHFLSFKNDGDEDRHNAEIIAFKFLNQLESANKDGLTRKEIAKLLGISAPHLTQLYRGNKLVNLLTLAKIERIFDIEFEISTNKNVEKKINVDFNTYSLSLNISKSLPKITTTNGDALMVTNYQKPVNQVSYTKELKSLV